MPDPFMNILHRALASGSRSTVLNPLGWLVLLTLAGAISAFKFDSPLWFANILGVLCIVSIILYVVAYIYYGLTDKDALRSEKYSIQKMAIQQGFIGDDQTGYIVIDNYPDQGTLPSPDQTKGPEEDR